MSIIHKISGLYRYLVSDCDYVNIMHNIFIIIQVYINHYMGVYLISDGDHVCLQVSRYAPLDQTHWQETLCNRCNGVIGVMRIVCVEWFNRICNALRRLGVQ
jgi:hypothetical protein